MEVGHLHHCFFLAILLMLCPDFLPKRPLPRPSLEILKCSRHDTLPWACDSVESTLFPNLSDGEFEYYFTMKSVLSMALPRSSGNEMSTLRRLRKSKSMKQRLRFGRRHQKKTRNSDVEPKTRTSVKPTHSSFLEKRRRIEDIWDDVNSYKRFDAGEQCGTRWTIGSSPRSKGKFLPHKTYGTQSDSMRQLDRNRRHAIQVARVSESSIVYFSGSYIMKRTDLSFRSNLFTVELWVKPDSGQNDPAVILNAGRFLSRKHYECKWAIGIGSSSSNSKPRFYFSRQNRDGTTATIHSPYVYKIEEWVHLAVSCGGGVIRLFVNGAQVAARHDPKEELSRRGVKCNSLILGGNEKMTHGYRGLVDKLVVLPDVRPQPDIRDDMYHLEIRRHFHDVAIADEFDVLGDWETVGLDAPVTWNEDTPEQENRLHFAEVTTPPCGQTVCDNPSIVKSYAENWTLRRPKTLRYNVVNINEDDGSRPMFTQSDVAQQAALLSDAFGPHNITWVPTLVHVNNSKIRRKTIGCEASKIGNRQCDMECNHERMGFDGGDCDLTFTVCEESKKGNERCDEDCNKAYHSWDLGDCCNPRFTDIFETCFDPTSANRAYLSIAEYKDAVAADNSGQLNVLFADWSNPNSIGVSTFPWDKEVFTSQGGTVVQLRPYASREEISGLVHELGHNLGLLHVHHGAHNVECGDACAELKPSMITGDLCEDTNPTPLNTNCDEPALTQAVCGMLNFTRTPYNNFMSYADGSCQDNFTPQQRARMHCYIDLFYSVWSEGVNIAPIPLAPQVIATSTSQRFITLAWAPPINEQVVPIRQCNRHCLPDKRLKQYATTARGAGSTEGDWSSGQATGPPDQATCVLDGIHFWMPAWSETTLFDCNIGVDRCALELEFQIAVIPSKLRIWISYGTDDNDGIRSVELLHEDNTITVITGLRASCEAPLSLHVLTTKLTRKIRINVTNPFAAIDAAELISGENDASCSGCRRTKYKIHRDPPFPNDLVAITDQMKFTDKSCIEGITYSYWVQPSIPPYLGERSPAVQFRLGQGFCGDGIVQSIHVNGSEEECDDGNTEDEDGCNSICVTEKGFHCKGEPSLCYWYEGDGQCEEYEQTTDSSDCVSHDEPMQWAISASSSSAAIEAFFAGSDSFSCHSTDEVLGPPDAQCTTNYGTWCPCRWDSPRLHAREHWLRVTFVTPVVPSSVSIFVGPTYEDSHDYKETFSLVLPGRDEISSGPLTLSCAENPIVIPLQVQFVSQKVRDFIVKFRSHNTSIDAVGLTSKSETGKSSTPRGCVMERRYENANITCQITETLSAPGSLGTSWPHQTRCVVVCNRGYVPRSTQRITCRNGDWDSATECAPVSCGAPSHVEFASFSCETGHKLGDVCNFTCWRNAQLVGEVRTFVCLDDGLWSIPSAHCQPTCGRPPNIRFSSSSCDEFTKRTSAPGDTCKYRCKSGYHVIQQSETSHSRRGRYTCSADGTWKGSGCQPLLCPPISTVHEGYTCTKGLLFGSECTLSCPNSENNVTITCESNGRWSSAFTSCSEEATSCDFPRSPHGVEILCKGLSTGKTCKASCVLMEGLPPRDIVTKTYAFDVHPDGLDARTRMLVCIGERWFPNPNDLHCVESCDTQLKGNGFCDAVNDRDHCNWDGGDCCMHGRRRGLMPSPCVRTDTRHREEDIDFTTVKSPSLRTKNKESSFSPLRAHTARMSMADGGKRSKKRRRNRGRDDSRRKHKRTNRRRKKKHQRRNRG